MQHIDPDLAANIEGKSISTRILVFLTARDRNTDMMYPQGFWTGDVDTNFNIDGEARTYVATGGLLGVGPITQSTGFKNVRVLLTFAARTAELLQATRVYDVKYSPIEIHKVYLDAESLRPVADPVLELAGIVDTLLEKSPSAGRKGANLELKISPNMKNFTKTAPLRHSHASIADNTPEGLPVDNFGRYFDLTARVISLWK